MSNILWIDTETTGLVYGYHEVIQIGACLSDMNGESLNKEIELNIAAKHLDHVDPKAIEINGLDPNKGLNKSHAFELFKIFVEDTIKISDKIIIGGENVQFDETFIKAEGLSLLDIPGVDYHLFDVYPIGVYMLGLSHLEDVALALDIEITDELHCGLYDANLARRVWERYCQIKEDKTT